MSAKDYIVKLQEEFIWRDKPEDKYPFADNIVRMHNLYGSRHCDDEYNREEVNRFIAYFYLTEKEAGKDLLDDAISWANKNKEKYGLLPRDLSISRYNYV